MFMEEKGGEDCVDNDILYVIIVVNFDDNDRNAIEQTVMAQRSCNERIAFRFHPLD